MEVHVMNTLARRLGLAFLMLALSFAANATYHLFRITQVYSNADGSVQYILLTATSGGQQYITGKNIKSSQGSVTRTFTFTKDLPGDTAMTEAGGSSVGGGTLSTGRLSALRSITLSSTRGNLAGARAGAAGRGDTAGCGGTTGGEISCGATSRGAARTGGAAMGAGAGGGGSAGGGDVGAPGTA